MSDSTIYPDEFAPNRTPEHTVRLAWTVIGLSTLGFLLLCALLLYGLWQFRANTMTPQEGSVLEANAAPVYRVQVGEVQPVAVTLGKPGPLREGETILVGQGAPPGTAALVTLWEGSTVQLYAGTELAFPTLRATTYSGQRAQVLLDLRAGQVLLGVARTERYKEVEFVVQMAGGRVRLEADGTYLLRLGETSEVAVRRGQAHLSPSPEGAPLTVMAGEKAILAPDGIRVTSAHWDLLSNGAFQGLSPWAFRVEPPGNGNASLPAYRLEPRAVNGEETTALVLERWGGNVDRRLARAVVSQEVGHDLSPYRSVRLEFDLLLSYQSLVGGGPVGQDYPFAVRIRYQDAEGQTRTYLYGFYYRPPAENFPSGPSTGGEALPFPHYRWEHVSLELLRAEPPPVFLIGVDLIASGHDYAGEVANLSLTAR